MGLWIAVLAILAIITYRVLTRKRRARRLERKAERRAARQNAQYNRIVKGKGRQPVRICTEKAPNGRICGLPAGKCQHLRRQAGHAAGMIGKLKK